MSIPSIFSTSIDGRAAVRTVGVTKHYGNRRALAGLDLVVPEEGIYLLAGLNGAGKSTALRLLLHLETPDAGTIEVLGCDVPRHALRARTSIGYISDEGVTPYAWLTVGGLIAHHAQYYPTWDSAYAARLIADLAIDLAPRVRALSRGQARRIAFVLALAHRPRLLILDEPTDGLDPVIRERVLHLLAEHAAESPTTILVSTHLIHEVERLADSVGTLKDGRLTGQWSRDQLRAGLQQYRFDAPDGWRPSGRPDTTIVKTTASGRDHVWTIWGEQGAVRAMLSEGGNEIRSITPLTLADSVVALLSTENAI